MSRSAWAVVARHLEAVAHTGTLAACSDADLLDRFRQHRDEAAFGALVQGHGPMVRAVCRRIVADPHTADDAFQATFLVLARRAGSVRNADRLGPWLHRVAVRVATRAAHDDRRRRSREVADSALVANAPAPVGPEPERARLLHEELDRLPDRYRLPVLLCDLQRLTHEEAARRLGWPVGTVKGRQARARDRLRDRLTRRGLVAPVGLITASLATDAQAVLPAMLAARTATVALNALTGASAAVTATAAALALSQGVHVPMWFSPLKLTALAALLGGGLVATQVGSRSPGQTPRPSAGATPPSATGRTPAPVGRSKDAAPPEVRAPGAAEAGGAGPADEGGLGGSNVPAGGLGGPLRPGAPAGGYRPQDLQGPGGFDGAGGGPPAGGGGEGGTPGGSGGAAMGGIMGGRGGMAGMMGGAAPAGMMGGGAMGGVGPGDLPVTTPAITDEERGVREQELELAEVDAEMLEEDLNRIRARIDRISEAIGANQLALIQLADKDEDDEPKRGLQTATDRLTQQLDEARKAYRSGLDERRQIRLRQTTARRALEAPSALPATFKPGDLVQIEVISELPGLRPDAGPRRVQADGTIALDFYGDVKIAGLDRQQAKVAVIRHLQNYLSEAELGLVRSDAEGNPFPVDPVRSEVLYLREAGVSPTPPKPVSPASTDRIEALERRLDEVLRKLDKLQPGGAGLPDGFAPGGGGGGALGGGGGGFGGGGGGGFR